MTMHKNETGDLISADKVDGTAVYGREGDKIGSVKTIMLEKRGGRVANAVISAGGFLGIGEKYHSIPWSKLKYDTSLGGYKLDVTEDQLRSGPSFDPRDAGVVGTLDYQRRVYSHYGETPFWQ